MDSKVPKVSVILPVFNPGTGLKRCIQSLKDQTLKDIEILFVDDCSTDDSIFVIEKELATDSRVKIFKNKTNMGAGCSRNIGIEAATGEYLCFIDPDDYIAYDFLELLYSASNNGTTDIVKGEFRKVNYKGIIHGNSDPLNNRIRKGIQENKQLFTLFTNSHWTGIYRREFIISSGIRYGTSRTGEDTTFLLRACYYAKGISLKDDAVYFYVAREESSVNNFSPIRLSYEFDSMKEKVDFFRYRFDGNQETILYLCSHVTYILKLAVTMLEEGDKRETVQKSLYEIKDYLCDIPYVEDMINADSIVKAFLLHDTALTKEPFETHAYKVPYHDYYSIVVHWVNYICRFPEYEMECRQILWLIFENAIVHLKDSNLTRKEKKAMLINLRKEARKIPDQKVFSDDFISMKLFVKYGINMFSLRETSLGKHIKSLLSCLKNKDRTK